MKKQKIFVCLFGLLPFLVSCRPAFVEKRVVIGESEILTLPSGQKNYAPISHSEDLEDAIFLQESSGEETIHLEFDLAGKQLIQRTNGEKTNALFYKIENIHTYLDTYEILTDIGTFRFIKVGPRVIKDEDGIRYTRIN